MARIADKHGLTNRYRESGSKRIVKRGRPRKYLFGSPKHRYKSPSHKARISTAQNFTYQELTPKEKRAGCLTMLIVVIMVILLIVSVVSCSKQNDKYMDYTYLTQPNHPLLYDEFDVVKEFYRGYLNVSVGSYQSHPEVERPILTALSYLDYDRIYLLTLNLNNLEQTFTMDEAINIALDYIPVDMILENFEFEKAIYKTKADGKKQYECYYIQKKGGVEKPGFYYDGNDWIKLKTGFSLVIEETLDDSYIVKIGDDWYDNVYSALTIGWNETIEKEKATHQDWDFSIEEYLNPQPMDKESATVQPTAPATSAPIGEWVSVSELESHFGVHVKWRDMSVVLTTEGTNAASHVIYITKESILKDSPCTGICGDGTLVTIKYDGDTYYFHYSDLISAGIISAN